MILRPRQQVFVDRCRAALEAHHAALGVAPTGAGKTVMLSAVAAGFRRVLVIQHRLELVRQNLMTFQRMAPDHTIGVVTADEKQWGRDVLFAMAQTLSRESNLALLPPRDLVIVDEAHHAAAPTYRAILDTALERNPFCKILGVTATPSRGDKQGLRKVFSVCADQITLGELIRAGHLVPPKAYVMDVGVNDQLASIRKMSTGEYDLDQAGSVLGAEPVLDAVLEHWFEKAGKRQTVAFCATVAHAESVCQHFEAAGIVAALVTGETPDQDRARTFRSLADGTVQVLVNVAVATEGWDCPPVSCVVLLRPSSYKSTVVQMIGRGLRPCDPERFPGIVKTDCVVLDFGRSIAQMGGLEQIVDLTGEEPAVKGEAPIKTCPECEAVVPTGVRECPFCGYSFRQEVEAVVRSFSMRVVELVEASPFRWVRHNERTWVASGITASAVVFRSGGIWHAAGISEHEGHRKIHRLLDADESLCLAAADDFLRLNGDQVSARKVKKWMDEPVSEKQRVMLGIAPTDFSVSKYDATCRLTLAWNRDRIARAYDLRRTA